jgi:hypothetical protein
MPPWYRQGTEKDAWIFDFPGVFELEYSTDDLGHSRQWFDSRIDLPQPGGKKN